MSGFGEFTGGKMRPEHSEHVPRQMEDRSPDGKLFGERIPNVMTQEPCQRKYEMRTAYLVMVNAGDNGEKVGITCDVDWMMSWSFAIRHQHFHNKLKPAHEWVKGWSLGEEIPSLCMQKYISLISVHGFNEIKLHPTWQKEVDSSIYNNAASFCLQSQIKLNKAWLMPGIKA